MWVTVEHTGKQSGLRGDVAGVICTGPDAGMVDTRLLVGEVKQRFRVMIG